MPSSLDITTRLSFRREPRASPNNATEGERVISRDLELTLWSMHIDKAAALLTREFARCGIDSILLKGPAISSWLYQDGTSRPYGDADLLVSPGDWRSAQSLLRELGFIKDLGPLDHPGMGSHEGEAWVRGGENIDLHCAIWGLGAEPDQVWKKLSRGTETIEVAGAAMRVLAPEARTLLLATHAAKHGDGWAVTDLERGLQQLPGDLWSKAAALASELDAVPTFVGGLHLVAGGSSLVGRLGLPDVPSPEATLRVWRVPMALGLEQLSHTAGLPAKLGVICTELFPTPAFLRWWTPMARRGGLGLALAYAWRFAWVVRHALPAIRAWRRARRGSISES